ncbi:putative toxin-antitoxin system toxin component, PIN family [Candidatus Desantisbacteria bacterium CG_4_10_14_0_8_um_filter_39_17]|uniref:Putative toxin-antitoxin system toxin component, PIN family n=1 Tax=Candidatus Desantisbacteria bacterium CG_4_10_14_0_8_um_filter_39_17 TaxID=1974542 RepID=A0A2H9P9G1_9BACT|nr:MAG: putative toxin-antitoxin system toxin component, PIN family [Candidatus Desantisbacteria bacterium CG_4_10_14_0_8_um_filter_39_17]
MFKVIIDTNIFIAAYFKSTGTCAKVVDLWTARVFQLVVSDEILDEYEEVLLRKDISPKLVKDLNTAILQSAVYVIPSKRIRLINDDPEDNKFLECAESTEVKYIISGDKHLKKLGKYKSTRIISPQQFLQILAER